MATDVDLGTTHDDHGPPRAVSVGLAFFGAFLSLLAWLGAHSSCGGDGTVAIGSPGVHQSGLCRRLDLPGAPTSPDAIILTLALVGAVVACVLLAEWRQSKWQAFGAGLAALAIGSLGLFFAVTATDVTFVGAG